MLGSSVGRAHAVGFAAVALLILVGMNFGTGALRQATPASDATPAALDTQSAEPARCRVGIAMTSLHNLDVPGKTFDAAFWIWSVCPDDRHAPLSTMEFVNGDSIAMSLAGENVVDGVYWDYAKVEGTFRHHWDVTDFPFDRQTLRIEIEDTQSVAADFVYSPDDTGTTLEPQALEPDGWRVASFDLAADTFTYHTTYGDPTGQAGTSDYSRLVLTVTMERDDLTSFAKLTFLVYIAFLISLISYFVLPEDPGHLAGRLGITSGTLFVVALGIRTATSALSSEENLTLVDKIHIVALGAILIDAVAALTTYLLIKRGHSTSGVEQFNRLVMVAVVVGFVGANAWLIGRAAFG